MWTSFTCSRSFFSRPLYVSSYTSTLSVLATAMSNAASETNNPSLLVIAQTRSLHHVEEEVRRIKEFDVIVETMVDDEATHDAVLRRLPDHPYVHFACHSSKHPESFHSSFRLWDDDRLELLEIIKARLTNAEHAFLSSCHGAAADIEGNPDEMINLASALQFCGYRGVVGTLWEMEDKDGPSIAEDFYGFMFCHGKDGKVDVKDSARALNTAIQEMEKRSEGLIAQWINFIHIGI
jgi:CHAT domain-containing protein